MPDYKMNTPIIASKETLWYRTLRAIYKANRPLHKKEWLTLANIQFSDKEPIKTVDRFAIKRTEWSYRHWRGLYPAMFKKFQQRGLVHYDHKENAWYLHRPEYRVFCKNLNVEL